jgi:hypothetical protein
MDHEGWALDANPAIDEAHYLWLEDPTAREVL